MLRVHMKPEDGFLGSKEFFVDGISSPWLIIVVQCLEDQLLSNKVGLSCLRYSVQCRLRQSIADVGGSTVLSSVKLTIDFLI